MHHFNPAMQSLAEATVAYALDRVRLDPPPLDGPRTKAELDRLGTSITTSGLGGMSALRLFCEYLAPACIAQDHQRNVAFVPSAPTEAAVLFDLVVGSSSVYAGSWMEGAGAVWAENQALRWLADLAGFPPEAGGVFVSGGTSGNLAALVAARQRAREKWGAAGAITRALTHPVIDVGWHPDWWVIAGAGAHSSISAVSRVMDVDVLTAPSAELSGRLTADGLRRSIDALRANGIAVGTADLPTGFAADVPQRPRGVTFAVVATGGTTNAGVIDDIEGVAEICAREGLWLHVDGAYGLAALAAPSARHRFTGIEQADSFVVDPHKWLFAPFDCAALVYRDPAVAKRAHTQHAAYLDVLHDDDDEWNPSDYAVHLTRRARGLPFWFSLATWGTAAYADAVEEALRVVAEVRKVIDARRDHLELVVEPELSILMFRRLGWTDEQYNAWSDRLLADQKGFCPPTKWHGETVLRFCVVSPRTTVADLVGLLDTLV